MRHLSILTLVALFVVSLGATAVVADEPASHSCAKVEKDCCKKNEDCCKKADAACCKEAKACCDDADCCKTAADGTHTCAMKHADGSVCAKASCCTGKSCEAKKTT
jgi:hypothetical protein